VWICLWVSFLTYAEDKIDYENIYPSNEKWLEAHILFGINQWLKYDSETGHPYIELSRPSHVWFGNTKIDGENYAGDPRVPKKYQFSYKKETFWDRTLAIEHSCDHESFYQTWDCNTDWIQSIEKSVGQKVAIWTYEFPISIVNKEKSDAVSIYRDTYKIQDFFFSSEKLPEKNMILFNKALYPEKKLYNQPHTITLRIPKNIHVVESYRCEKDNENQYHYHTNLLWSIAENLYASYYYNAFIWYTPLKKDFYEKEWERRKFTEYDLDREVHTLFVSSILQDLNFCEYEAKYKKIRQIQKLLFPQKYSSLFRK